MNSMGLDKFKFVDHYCGETGFRSPEQAEA